MTVIVVQENCDEEKDLRYEHYEVDLLALIIGLVPLLEVKPDKERCNHKHGAVDDV